MVRRIIDNTIIIRKLFERYGRKMNLEKIIKFICGYFSHLL